MTNKRKPLNFLIGRSFFMQKSDVADNSFKILFEIFSLIFGKSFLPLGESKNVARRSATSE
jgi:hypothetical protein